MSIGSFAPALPRPLALPSVRPVRRGEPLGAVTRPVAEHPDRPLLRAARGGDPAAFEALVRQYQGPLYNFCLRLLGGPEDAGDVVQDVFVQLYGHLDTLDEREPLAPWLFRVARNRAIDLIRRRRSVPFGSPAAGADDDDWGPSEPVDAEPLPDELAERADLQRLLSEAIASLPPLYAEVVALRYAGDRSFAEIAHIVGCDEGAARVRFHRAKALLRRYLRALGPHSSEEDRLP